MELKSLVKLILSFFILSLIFFGFSLKKANAAIIDSCDTTTGWHVSGTATSPTLDSVIFKEGTASINMGRSGAAGSYYRNVAPFNGTDKSVYVWLYVANTSGFLSVNFRVGSATNVNCGYVKPLGLGQLVYGWNLLSFPIATGQIYCSPDITNLNFLAFTIGYGGPVTSGSLKMDDWDIQTTVTGQVNILASVDPSLTLTLTSAACNLGTFDSANLKTCSYGAEVSTNGSSGYTSFIKSDGNLRNATNSIANVSSGNVTAATESYGLSTTKDSQTISQINDADSDTYYTQADCTSLDNQNSTAMTASALTTSDQTFASSSGPIAADSTYLCHAVTITGTTPAGAYSQLVTITVVGNF